MAPEEEGRKGRTTRRKWWTGWRAEGLFSTLLKQLTWKFTLNFLTVFLAKNACSPLRPPGRKLRRSSAHWDLHHTQIEEERMHSTGLTWEQSASNSKDVLNSGHGQASTFRRQFSDGKFAINHTVIISCVGLKIRIELPMPKSWGGSYTVERVLRMTVKNIHVQRKKL